MQTQVASLLMIVSSVMLASVVIGYAVLLTENTVSVEDNGQIDRILALQEEMLNQTSTWLNGLPSNDINQTQTQP